MYLLDTNVCIEFLLRPTEPLVARMDEHFGKLTISAISVAELRVGKQTSTDRKRDEERLNVFLANIDVCDFNDAAAIEYGHLIRATMMDRKTFDRLIAAHALALGCIVVTNDKKHFADVPGLKVENWTA